MVRYYIHEKMTIDTAKAYQTIQDTYNEAPADLNLDPTGQEKTKAF